MRKFELSSTRQRLSYLVVFHKNYVKQVLKDRSQAYSSVQHSLIDLNTRVVFSSLWVSNLIQFANVGVNIVYYVAFRLILAGRLDKMFLDLLPFDQMSLSLPAGQQGLRRAKFVTKSSSVLPMTLNYRRTWRFPDCSATVVKTCPASSIHCGQNLVDNEYPEKKFASRKIVGGEGELVASNDGLES